MKTSEIVIGETYRTRHHTVIVLAKGWKNVKIGWETSFAPGGSLLAVAVYRGYMLPTGWRPELVGAQQIECTLAEYNRRFLAEQTYRAEERIRRDRQALEDQALRTRVVALTEDMDTYGSLGSITISRGELRHLLKLAENVRGEHWVPAPPERSIAR